MIFSLTRFRLAAALGVVAVGAAAGCDRGSDARVPAGESAAGQIAAAPTDGQYDPAITVYKEPT